jgi:molybdate transport system permease protein
MSVSEPRQENAQTGRGSRRPSTSLVLALLSVPLLVLLALPLVGLVASAPLATLADRLSEATARSAIWVSVVTSSMTVCIAIVFGTPLGYLLARSAFAGRRIVETLVELPMVLPPSVAGVALLVAFGRRGLFGEYLARFGVEVAFTSVAVVLAQLFVAAPYYVRAAAGAFARIDRDLEHAAEVLGASRLRVFTRITIPLVWPSLLGGIVMTWARALGEFGATIIFAGNYPGRTQTMPLAIYIGFEIDLGTALALATVLLAFSFTVLIASKHFLARDDWQSRT